MINAFVIVVSMCKDYCVESWNDFAGETVHKSSESNDVLRHSSGDEGLCKGE